MTTVSSKDYFALNSYEHSELFTHSTSKGKCQNIVNIPNADELFRGHLTINGTVQYVGEVISVNCTTSQQIGYDEFRTPLVNLTVGISLYFFLNFTIGPIHQVKDKDGVNL